MTTDDFLRTNTALLTKASIPTARLDCLVLLEDVLQMDRAHILSHADDSLNSERLSVLNKFIQRRTVHEPLAYIRNKVEFFGRKYYVDERVLIPRPESESIINLLKALTLPPGTNIADIGTGSGALAITAALEIPNSNLIATDISTTCLEVAARNAQAHAVTVNLLGGNLLSPVESLKILPDVLMCNLPYVPADYPVNRAASYEPAVALYGGHDGLDLYRELFTYATRMQHKPTYILSESLPSQHSTLETIARSAGFILRTTEGFAQSFKRS